MLESHPSHALAQKLLPKGAGSVFSFDMKGNREQGKKFIEALKVFSHLANVGDCRSLVIHPASTTHFRMSDEALADAGITQGTIRLSIGLEDPDDLIDDLKRALKAAQKALRSRDVLQVNGHKTYCYTGGKPFDAAKPTVVFIHGVLNDHSVWILQTRYLAHHGWNVLAVDLPGHCKSEGEAPAIGGGSRRLRRRPARCRRRRPRGAGGPQLGLADRAGGGVTAQERVTHLVLVGTAYPMKVSRGLAGSFAARAA